MPRRSRRRREVTSRRFPLRLGEVLERWGVYRVIRTAPLRAYRFFVRRAPMRSVEEPAQTDARRSAQVRPGHCVFVYGTLRRGEGNHYLLEEQDFLGEATSALPCFQMRAHVVPFVSYLPEGAPGGARVRGELYRVDDECLRRLDRFEGHPNFYTRQERMFLDPDGRPVVAWIYLCARGGGPRIEPTGDPPALEAPRYSLRRLH